MNSLTKQVKEWLEEAKNHSDYQELIQEFNQEPNKNVELNFHLEKILRLFWSMGYLTALRESSE